MGTVLSVVVENLSNMIDFYLRVEEVDDAKEHAFDVLFETL